MGGESWRTTLRQCPRESCSSSSRSSSSKACRIPALHETKPFRGEGEMGREMGYKEEREAGVERREGWMEGLKE